MFYHRSTQLSFIIHYLKPNCSARHVAPSRQNFTGPEIAKPRPIELDDLPSKMVVS